MEPVWELDHNDRALARRSQEPSNHSAARLSPNLPKHYLHTKKASTGLRCGKSPS